MRETGIGSLLGIFKQDRLNSVGCSSYSKHQGIMVTLKDNKEGYTQKYTKENSHLCLLSTNKQIRIYMTREIYKERRQQKPILKDWYN